MIVNVIIALCMSAIAYVIGLKIGTRNMYEVIDCMNHQRKYIRRLEQKIDNLEQEKFAATLYADENPISRSVKKITL